ncbi:hypothetical protein [Clavibacter michiganensis]|uniref:hypothetical protein n=1 Tax=Clavibacter michiganensis TaxID=28447 RepID=UPI001186A976|nr:hypothetical protein [Clavibacter michiganensis]
MSAPLDDPRTRREELLMTEVRKAARQSAARRAARERATERAAEFRLRESALEELAVDYFVALDAIKDV